MEQTAIIKEREFMTSPTREFVMGLCDEGKIDEARAHLAERIKTLADTEQLLECRNLQAMVERCAKNYTEALRIHVESYPLALASDVHVLKGRFHGGSGITFEVIGVREDSSDYIKKALSEYEEASRHFQKAGDMDGAGDVENNLGMLLCALGRTGEAREHLVNARAYFEGKPVKLAQVDDTEARIYLREGNPVEALYLSCAAVRVFIRHGEERLLTEARRTLMKAAADSGMQ